MVILKKEFFLSKLVSALILVFIPVLAVCEVCELPQGAVDFRSPSVAHRNQIAQVVGAHFTASVQQGVGGNTGSLMADLDYTLRHIPNHPQALMVAMKHQQSKGYTSAKAGRRDYLWPTTKCYFKRAHLIAPGDSTVYLVEGIYYHRKKEYKPAEEKYLRALELGKSPRQAVHVYYNLGLLYLDIDDYEKAQSYADKAYSLNYPLPGLKNRLDKRSAKNK